MAPGSCEMWVLSSFRMWIFWATELIPKFCGEVGLNVTFINEIHAHVKIIESHAYTMPTISEVHHVYTEPITTIWNDLCSNPNLNRDV